MLIHFASAHSFPPFPYPIQRPAQYWYSNTAGYWEEKTVPTTCRPGIAPQNFHLRYPIPNPPPQKHCRNLPFICEGFFEPLTPRAADGFSKSGRRLAKSWGIELRGKEVPRHPRFILNPRFHCNFMCKYSSQKPYGGRQTI
ncbi:hypothetical protein CDAR_582911 [Caerostris darwini]|uniref:Uncharacterized protein n=1 Tax=Caerostris darwini TaxID=1538125 RepID=A0AAV4SFU5_9ARAC|nr:hypothetical protein CDAR_582911 [Caerostris darwini]